MEVDQRDFGTCESSVRRLRRAQADESAGLHRPIVSGDGHYVASVTPENSLRLLRLSEDGGVQEFANAPLPKPLHQLTARLSVFLWGPTADDVPHVSENGDANVLIPLLLLSDGFRLVMVNPNKTTIDFKEATAKNGTSADHVVADYQLGDQFGKLSYATFVFDADRVLVLFEMGANGSIISLTRPHRDDLPNVKFNSDRAIAVSPDGRSLAMLLRTKGQDQVTVLGLKEQDVQVQATFNTHTNDAQGLIWSPDGDPVIAVHDSATYGLKMLFFSALGHPLKRFDIFAFDDSSNALGLGITNQRWVAAASGTVLAVADGDKRVLVRRQHNRMMVSVCVNDVYVADAIVVNSTAGSACPWEYYRRIEVDRLATDRRCGAYLRFAERSF